MTKGDFAGDKSLADAWADFCARLHAAGERVFKDHNPANDLQRADGFRFLTQNLSQAFDLALESRDTRYPWLHPFCGPTRKLGADNADCIYLQAWIDGRSTYKISGRRGSARAINFAVQGPRRADGVRPLHDPFGDTPEASLSGDDLNCEWDGSFTLYIGGPRRGPNWLPTTAGSRKLFLRQFFDRWDEEAASYRIERLNMKGPRPMPDSATMVEAIGWAGSFVTGLMNDWPEWCHETKLGCDPSIINVFPGQNDDSGDALRGRLINNMAWRLAPDRALIIEFDAHDAFWMFTNMGAFWSSMDYIYRSVSWTPGRAATDSDGKVRLVMAHDDPGYHNWIDTQRFESGALAYRSVGSTIAAPIRVSEVAHANLAAHMPADSAMVTPDERLAQMHARFNAIRRRYRL